MVVNVAFSVALVAFCALMFASDCFLGKKLKALEAKVASALSKRENLPKM